MADPERRRLVGALTVVGLGMGLWFLPAPAGLKPAAMHLIAVFVATIAGLILQPLPQEPW